MDEIFSIVGRSPEIMGSREKVTGRAKFTVDMKPPGMLYAKILRSPYAHAKILKIDTSRAERLPGVKAVLTHKEARILYRPSHGSAREFGLDDRVRYVGDKVAAVSAINEDVAEEALELIDVEYNVLPAVFDVEEASKPDAPVIHPERDDIDGNILDYNNQTYGDLNAGLREADHIIENRYVTSRVCHCSLEPHACLSSWDESGNLTMWSSEQTAFPIQASLAEALNLPMNRIRVIVPPYVGGGFGAKYENAEKIVCALLAKKASRPVMLKCTREEEFYTTRVRSRCVFYTKTGVKRDGTLTARYLKAFIDVGAYAYGAIMALRAGAYLTTLYRCPNITYEGYGVFTNTPSSGPMRGFTSTPVHFAMESDMDHIAEELGMDPVELRQKNHLRTGDTILFNKYTVSSSGLDECIQKGVKQIGWEKRQKKAGRLGDLKKKGIGMALFSHYAPKLSPSEKRIGSAIIKMNDDGSFQLMLRVPDIGQGLRTTMAQIAAEVVGACYEDVSVTLADTETTPWGGTTAASRSMMETGGAVKEAAEKVKREIFELASELLEASPENLVSKGGRVYVKGIPERGMSFSEVLSHPDVKARGDNIIVSKAVYQVPSYVPPYGAQFAEVEVDMETGQVEVLKLVAAHDVGRAIHPKSVEGQIEGGVSMGLGYALT
jgi:xanthine dehydrogenase molybdenum-binding subunit